VWAFCTDIIDYGSGQNGWALRLPGFPGRKAQMGAAPIALRKTKIQLAKRAENGNLTDAEWFGAQLIRFSFKYAKASSNFCPVGFDRLRVRAGFRGTG
jgi:hypothetical protein